MSLSGTDPEEVTVACSEPPDEEAKPGAKLGRYVVLDSLGRGGMGQVHRAYDPKLHREVALKQVLRKRLRPEDEARLIREARAMAQLSHPNAVAVYDVEITDAGLAIAMELVTGRTLRDWMDAEEHSWPQVRRMFEQAGLALAAAHAADLIHRDFKPTNVLVSEAGVVKVTDFGLAKSDLSGSNDSADEADPPSDSMRSSDPGLETLTQEGAVLGTPRYMAPEQAEGRTEGGATDQYAFCVALWEATVGKPPFRGRNAAALAFAKARGAPKWPRPVGVPLHVGEALRRGLSPTAGDRWPSMNALLEVLRHDPAARRRRLVATAATLAAVAGVGALGVTSLDGPEDPCPLHDEPFEDTWDDARRGEVEAAMLATKLPFAEGTWARTSAMLDSYAAQWAESQQDACAATKVRGEQSQEAMDLRMACLDRMRSKAAAIIDQLAEGSARTTERAERLLSTLPPIAGCHDLARLRSAVPPPDDPEVERAVRAARAKLEVVQVKRAAGQIDRARAMVAELESEAERLGYEPLRAEVLAEAGNVASSKGDIEAAEPHHRRALRLAIGLKMHGLASYVAADLARALAMHTGRFDEALHAVELAESFARAADEPRAQRGAQLERAIALNAAGRYDEAALVAARYVEREGLSAGARIAGFKVLSDANRNAGHLVEAEEAAREAVDVATEARGSQHPATAGIRSSLASVLTRAERYDDAQVQYEASLSTFQRMFGEDDPRTAGVRSNYANLLRRIGKVAEAERHYRLSVRSFERVYGRDSQLYARARSNLGMALQDRGDFEGARAEFEAALEVLLRDVGPDHPQVALVHGRLSGVFLAQSQPERAESHAVEALRIGRQTWEPGLDLSATILQHAQVLLALERDDEARVELEAALTGLAPTDPARHRAAIEFALAQALRGSDQQPQRAVELARTALAVLAPAQSTLVDEIRAFLAEPPSATGDVPDRADPE